MTDNLQIIFIIICVVGLASGCRLNAKQTIPLTCSPISDTLQFLSYALDQSIQSYRLPWFDVQLQFYKPFEGGKMEIKIVSAMEIIFKIEVVVPEVDSCYRFVSNFCVVNS